MAQLQGEAATDIGPAQRQSAPRSRAAAAHRMASVQGAYRDRGYRADVEVVMSNLTALLPNVHYLFFWGPGTNAKGQVSGGSPWPSRTVSTSELRYASQERRYRPTQFSATPEMMSRPRLLDPDPKSRCVRRELCLTTRTSDRPNARLWAEGQLHPSHPRGRACRRRGASGPRYGQCSYTGLKSSPLTRVPSAKAGRGGSRKRTYGGTL